MAQNEPTQSRDLEAERQELLTLVGAAVPVDLQESIASAISLTQQTWDWRLISTQGGTGNAESE